mgnify:FL=1
MYIRMNHYIELLLAASIVVLLMHVPEFLQEMAASSLGKMLLLSVVVFLLCFCGKNAGLMAAVIYIIVVYKTDKENFNLLDGFNVSISTGKKETPKDDASCKAANADYPKWDSSKKKCVAESMAQREGMNKKKKIVTSDDASCKKADPNKPYWNDTTNLCQTTEPFSLEEITTLKKMAGKKEGFGNFSRQRNLQTHEYKLSHQNTTDNDRKVKVKAEKAKMNASKEMADEKNQSN